MSSDTTEIQCLDLSPFPCKVFVVHTEDQFEALCEDKGIKDRTWLDDSTFAEVMSHGASSIVKVGDLSKADLETRVNTYAHEATHVFQHVCQYVCEDNPSAEFEAYFIGRITTWLFKECECYLASISSSPEQPSSSEPALEPTLTSTTLGQALAEQRQKSPSSRWSNDDWCQKSKA